MLPDYTQGGFYDPSQSYQGVAGRINLGPQWDLPYQMAGTDQSPDAAYYAKLSQMGLGGTGNRARAAQGLYGMFQRGYGAARLNKNFSLYFPEYLDQARIGDIINQQSYEAQGLDPQRYQGRYRWQMRPGG